MAGMSKNSSEVKNDWKQPTAEAVAPLCWNDIENYIEVENVTKSENKGTDENTRNIFLANMVLRF